MFLSRPASWPSIIHPSAPILCDMIQYLISEWISIILATDIHIMSGNC